MSYRQATIWDAKTIADMWAETVRESGIPFLTAEGEEFEKLYLNVLYSIKHPEHYTWVLERDGEVKGFITASVHTLKWGYGGIIGQGDCVYVSPEYRGKGHCDKLIALAQRWCKKLGATMFTLETVYDTRLAKIWERKGWKPYKIIYGMEV